MRGPDKNLEKDVKIEALQKEIEKNKALKVERLRLQNKIEEKNGKTEK
jgi:hypothetical protein